MTSSNDKLRALFLSALMVLSVMAGTVAFAGSAAANHASNDADDHLTSGDTFWQGQELWLGNLTTGDTYQIRSVTDDGNVGGLEDEFIAETGGQAIVDTSNLDGFYVITHNGNVVSFDTDGTVLNDPEGGGVSEAQWEIAPQTLTAAFDEDDTPVTQGSLATLELDSNRAGYSVNITAESLDEGDLGDIFNQSTDNTGFVDGSDDDGDDSVQIRVPSNELIEANFSVFDTPGTYSFTVAANDTTAEDTASVDVVERDVDINFGTSVYTQQVGDVVDITLDMTDTSTAYVYIGGEDVNYFERVTVIDDDDDGEVTLSMNTFLAGQVNTSGGPNFDNSSGTGTGSTFQVSSGDSFGTPAVVRYNTTDFEANGAGGITISSTLDTPLEAGDYDLAVASEDHTSGEINVEAGSISIPSERDVAALDLVSRSTDGISLYKAPAGDLQLDDEELADLRESMTESDRITDGERLIIQVDASGLYGYIDEDTSLIQLSNPDGTGVQGVYLTITPSDVGPNQAGAAAFDLDGSNAGIMTVPDENSLFVIVDMDSTVFSAIEDGDSFDVEFRVGDEDETAQLNPYVDAEEEESVVALVSTHDPDAEFDQVVNAQLQVLQDSSAEVAGSTNVAPGTELSLRLRRTGENPFLKQKTITVQEDGTFSTTFDFSDVDVDTTFTAVVRRGNDRISDERTGIVVDELEEGPRGTVEAPPSPTPAFVPVTRVVTQEVTRTVIQDRTVTVTVTQTPGQPGFGIAVAIVALLAAALLALRRRD